MTVDDEAAVETVAEAALDVTAAAVDSVAAEIAIAVLDETTEAAVTVVLDEMQLRLVLLETVESLAPVLALLTRSSESDSKRARFARARASKDKKAPSNSMRPFLCQFCQLQTSCL
jgi:hypothetical protein